MIVHKNQAASAFVCLAGICMCWIREVANIIRMSHQPPTYINMFQNVSTRIDMYQYVSTCVDMYQPVLICINLH